MWDIAQLFGKFLVNEKTNADEKEKLFFNLFHPSKSDNPFYFPI
jgi:hypothetical protein